MHAWHDVPLGPDAPKTVWSVVETPTGSNVKYELDKPSGLIKADRILFSAVHYPGNYGFLPQTYYYDHDPLDILILGQVSFVPLCLVRARPIGLMCMLDQGERDDKVIAVHADDPEYAHYTSIKQLPPHKLAVVRRFFEDYKALENKTVVVKDFFGPREARKAVKDAIRLYKENERTLRAA
ncbi:MAG TPA: inorganic diphosphatase [Candidatus Obscuribacterales bacterium]